VFAVWLKYLFHDQNQNFVLQSIGVKWNAAEYGSGAGD